MQIPGYQNRIQIDTPNVPEPQVARAVPGAFGEQKAEALTQGAKEIGSSVEQLENHIYQQKIWEQQVNLYNSKEDLRNQIQDLQYSNDTAKIKDDKGNDIEVPSGYLNRQGFNAKGSTDDYTQKSNALREQYMSQFNLPVMKKMAARQFDGIVALGRNQVAQHEAKQIREGTANTFLSATQNEVKSAALASSPEDLKNSVDSVKEAYLKYGAYKGMDPETIKLGQDKHVSDAIHKSVMGNLLKTGDINKSRQLLDSQVDNLAPDDYDKISKAINDGADHIERAKEHAQVQVEIGNESDYLTKLSSGKLSWVNSDDIARDVRDGNISEKFGAAIIDVVKSEGKYTPQKDENENYPQLADGIYKAKDQEELHKGLLNLLQHHKDISQDKLSILINSAMNRGKNLPLSVKKGDSAQISPEQQEKDSGSMAVLNFGRRSGMSNNEISKIHETFLNEINNGKSVKEAYDLAVKNHAIAQYPPAATMDQPPNMVIGKDSPIRVIFPRSGKSGNARDKNISK